MQTRSAIRREAGFTLVELLVVIAIIGILVSLLLPAVQAARDAARRTQCANQLRQIGLAFHTYLDSQGTLPFGAYDHDYDGAPYDSKGTYRIGWTWRTLILPQLEQQPLFDQLSQLDPYERGGYNRNAPWATSPAQGMIMPGYICPSEPSPWVRENASPWSFTPASGFAISTYLGSAGPVTPVPSDGSWGGLYEACGICTDGTVKDAFCPCEFGNQEQFTRGFMHGHTPNGPGLLDMYPNGYTMADVDDGASNTLLVGETTGLDGNGDGCGEPGQDQLGWMSSWCTATTVFGINAAGIGGEWQNGCVSWRSYHPGGATFAFADGSVHFINDSVHPRTFGYLGHRNDGMALPTGF